MLNLRALILVVLAIIARAIVSDAAVAPNKMTIAYASIGPRSAVMEGIAFVLGPVNKAATIKLLQRRLHVSEREAEEGFVDMLIGMDKKPFPSMEGLRNIQRLMKQRNPKMANIKVEELVDDQILRRLDESGFIDKLFAAHGVK